MTTFAILEQEQRNWLIDSYVECECMINEEECEPDLIAANLEEMTDEELLDECVAFMPEILRDFETQFGEAIIIMF